tara:strand:- start:815 stop:1093 length:279 start_codon:yes stop_codon:yes gene_type:complete
MASIRSLKKSINNSLALFIDDCYEKMSSATPEQAKIIDKLIEDAIQLFDSLIASVNTPNSEMANSVYYKSVGDQLDQELGALYKALDEAESK